MAGIPVLLFLVRARFTRHERALFWTASEFLFSTGFFDSIGYNNYSMRGMFLPTIVFFYLFARYIVAIILRNPVLRSVAAVVIVLSVISTGKEIAYLTYQPLMSSIWYWKATDRPIPASVEREVQQEYATLARDSSVRYYTPDAHDAGSMHKYNAEKLVRLPVEAMATAEYELLRNPGRNLLW